MQGNKYLCSSGGPCKTNIQTSPESSRSIIIVLNTVHLAIDLSVTLIDRVEVELLKDPPGKEQAGAVAGSVVGQTNLNSIPKQSE